MYPTLNVTLTGTTNAYLALPVRGEITIHEQEQKYGGRVTATFRRLCADGRLAAPVEIAAPVFTFDHRVAAEMATARWQATRAQGAGWPVVDGELRCPDPECGEPLALLLIGAVGHCGQRCANMVDPISDARPTSPHPTVGPLLPDERPDVGDRASLDEAVRLAVRDADGYGADVDAVDLWIRDNRSGGPVPRGALVASIGRQVAIGELVQVDDGSGATPRYVLAPGD